MIIYRIANSKFIHDLSGEGAKLSGGRWNPKGVAVLYCAQHISLAALENLVYIHALGVQQEFSLLKLEVPDNEIRTLDPKALKETWHKDMDYTNWLGLQFIEQKGFILKIPSVIIQEEFNFLINVEHPLMKKVKIIKTSAFTFDQRLL